MINSARFTSTGAVAVEMDDGSLWQVDASLPPDERFRRLLADWVAAGGQIAPYVAPAPTIDDYSRAIQSLLDETAKLRRYDSIHTAIGYRDDPNPAYASEAQALFVWRSAVWTYVFAELAKVEGSTRPQPSVAEILAELPAMAWPA